MTETPKRPPIAEFALDASSASKRPEQLVNLLTRMLSQEFPQAFQRLEVVHASETAVVTLASLDEDELDEDVALEIAHRARAVYGEFSTSPWY